jgi:hypothetical protein
MSVGWRPSATAPTLVSPEPEAVVTLKYPASAALAVVPKRNRPANEHLLCSRRYLPF